MKPGLSRRKAKPPVRAAERPRVTTVKRWMLPSDVGRLLPDDPEEVRRWGRRLAQWIYEHQSWTKYRRGRFRGQSSLALGLETIRLQVLMGLARSRQEHPRVEFFADGSVRF